MRTSFSKVLLASAFVLLLSMPTLAAGHRVPARQARVSNPFTEALLQVWSYLAGALTKEGCGLDPDGRRCATASTSGSVPVSSDSGCTIDPSGRCLPGGVAPSSLDAGCGLDPNGHCGM